MVSVLVGLVPLDAVDEEAEEESVDGRGSLLANVGVSRIASNGSRSRGTRLGRRAIERPCNCAPWRA